MKCHDPHGIALILPWHAIVTAMARHEEKQILYIRQLKELLACYGLPRHSLALANHDTTAMAYATARPTAPHGKPHGNIHDNLHGNLQGSPTGISTPPHGGGGGVFGSRFALKASSGSCNYVFAACGRGHIRAGLYPGGIRSMRGVRKGTD